MLSHYYIQKNLKALNYYKGEIDEIRGKLEIQATKDFQHDFGLVVDGIFGEKTNAVMVQVIKECQTILQCSKIDGMWGNETETNYQQFKGIKHFQHWEFKCPCGCNEERIDIRLVKILDDIRDYYNKPLHITSGVRCPKHNRELPGSSSTSWHLSTRGGKASDIWLNDIKVTELLSHCIDLRNQGKIRYTYTNGDNMSGAVHIDIGGIR